MALSATIQNGFFFTQVINYMDKGSPSESVLILEDTIAEAKNSVYHKRAKHYFI